MDSFRLAYQQAIATILQEHGPIDTIGLFPAVPAPVAVLCGRELLPKVHPKLRVFDNDRAAGGFTFKLETISGKIRRVELRGREASQRAQGTRGVTEYWSDEL